MNERPFLHDVSRNCQRPEAEETGFRAPLPLWRRPSVPPDSRPKTHDANRTRDGGKADARDTTCMTERDERDGLLTESRRSSLFLSASSAGVVVVEAAGMTGVDDVCGRSGRATLTAVLDAGS
jgi:hypothetical protein